MLRTIRQVSERDSTVGGGAFVASIPRDNVAPNEHEPTLHGLSFMGIRWGLPERASSTFVHVPDEETEEVESPAVIADPFAGKMTLRITKGVVPSLAGAGAIPEEGSVELRLVALRSSEEIKELAEALKANRPGGEPPEP